MLAAGAVTLLATACGGHREPATHGGTTTTFHYPKHLHQPPDSNN